MSSNTGRKNRAQEEVMKEKKQKMLTISSFKS